MPLPFSEHDTAELAKLLESAATHVSSIGGGDGEDEERSPPAQRYGDSSRQDRTEDLSYGTCEAMC